MYENKYEVASALNRHISTIGSKISESITESPSVTPQQFLSSIPNSFVFRSVTDSEVCNAIVSLKNKSSSLDTYPTKVVKSIAPFIVPILTKLINESFRTSYFPEFLKIAKVIPIFKGGDETNANNYRPIAILHVFSKIFERITYNQL